MHCLASAPRSGVIDNKLVRNLMASQDAQPSCIANQAFTSDELSLGPRDITERSSIGLLCRMELAVKLPAAKRKQETTQTACILHSASCHAPPLAAAGASWKVAPVLFSICCVFCLIRWVFFWLVLLPPTRLSVSWSSTRAVVLSRGSSVAFTQLRQAYGALLG